MTALVLISGPTFFNISYREQDHHSDNEGVEEPSGSGKESPLCETDFRLSSAAVAREVSRREL